MFKTYQKFLYDFDNALKLIFETQKKYIKCKKGCTGCCSKGNYPFSQIEFAYLTQGFINLDDKIKQIVQNNIKELLQQKQNSKEQRFEHQCPFLINNECCVYEYRGIICRTFGVCYYDDKEGYVRLPDCVFDGLNYSDFFDLKTNTLNIKDVPLVNLRIDRVLNSELAKKYNIECGEIRSMLDWISAK
jgi:Fe-S-cluster containining protein